MMQEIEFYIEGSPDQRPNSIRGIYVDGTAGNQFRKGVDIELSHWRPNITEDKYKAGTSTEICFKYLHLHKDIDYDLVINNHLDVDGILSVFTLTHPTLALKYETILTDAAKAGDFWAWADGKALKVFQLLSLLFQKLKASNINMKESYKRCFSLIIRILNNPNDRTGAETILRNQYTLVENGKIIREKLNDRVVSYHIPQRTISGNIEKYLKVAKFNEPISERLSFWPQVRNRWDAQKLHLVSHETESGIHYELWIPGYCWADTKGLWQPSGLIPPQSMGEAHQLQWDNLSKTVGDLNAQESGPCYWNLFARVDFASSLNPRPFPIILSTVNNQDQRMIASSIPLELIKNAFSMLTN